MSEWVTIALIVASVLGTPLGLVLGWIMRDRVARGVSVEAPLSLMRRGVRKPTEPALEEPVLDGTKILEKAAAGFPGGLDG